MSELLFFIFNYKADTKPYYRREDKIYDYLNQEVKSEDLRARILDNPDVKYYRFNHILEHVESLPIVTNLIYMDDENFHSTYVVLSTTNNYTLKVLTLEELQFNLNDYVPYETFLLYPFPSPSQHPPFNVFLSSALRNQNKPSLIELSHDSNLDVIHIPISPEIKPQIDSKTGFPRYILIHNLRVGFINYTEFKKMLRAKKVDRYIIDESVQQWSKAPNTLITVFGINGITYLVNAYHDKEKNLIHPPKH